MVKEMPSDMSQKRFVAIKSRRRVPLRELRRNHPPDDSPTTPQEVIRFCIRIVMIFLGLIGLPAFLAHSFHRGPMPDVTAWLHTADAKVNVRVYHTGAGSTATVPLNTYILNVLAAEFTPGAPMSSLEAAAVATRTYAVRSIIKANMPSSLAAKHGSDVTDDGAVDLPTASEQDVQSEYGNQALQFLSKLQAAVETTDGLVLTYQKEPILAFMFDLSPGTTRDSQSALNRKIPYLKVIACPDDAVNPQRVSVNTFTDRDIAQAFSVDSINLNDVVLDRGKDGFVRTVREGKHVLAASTFASRLSLPSTDFTSKVTAGNLIITSYGRGTDIGMSLNEAQALARRGDSWQAILSHFYPGTTVQLDQSFLQ